MVYFTRRFVVCLTLCHFVLVFFSPFSIAITSLGEERANLSAFRAFDRFVLIWICRFPLPLGVWEGLRFVIVALLDFSFTFFFVIVALPRLFSYLFLGDEHCVKTKHSGDEKLENKKTTNRTTVSPTTDSDSQALSI